MERILKEIDREMVGKNIYPDESVYVTEKYTDPDSGITSQKQYRICVHYDDCAESPRDWDNVCTILSARGNWDVGDKEWSLGRDEARAKYEELKADHNIYMRPIYMYDHSGQTISLTPFGDPWDSGIFGYIFVSKDTMLKETNATEENWQERAQQIMESEIETYDAYITGSVYGFVIQEEQIVKHHNISTDERWEDTSWCVVDSCYGFYGDDFNESGLIAEATSFFDYVHSDVHFYTEQYK